MNNTKSFPTKSFRQQLEDILDLDHNMNCACHDLKSPCDCTAKWTTDKILSAIKERMPEKLNPPDDMEETIEILNSVRNAYSIVGSMNGYNNALDEIFTNLGLEE